jgi:HAE1 family hydrophobic/amphiphilic exporter-1
MVILVGVVDNDAIIIVDFINRARAEGMTVRAAIMEAGHARLRPVLMTTGTTILGLLPMALGFGRGADLRQPLALAVIGGLISSTALTLVVVPVAYTLWEDLRIRLGVAVGRRPVDAPQEAAS